MKESKCAKDILKCANEKRRNANSFWHLNIFEHDEFHANQLTMSFNMLIHVKIEIIKIYII